MVVEMEGMRRVEPAALKSGWRKARTGLPLLMLTIPSIAPAGEADIPALLEARRCNACHAPAEMLIGPPYQAIAARHAARAAVMEEALAQKTILGGGGNWGVVPMVPNEHVTPEEARAMVRWILELTGKTR
jgi:cytochrome c